MSDNNDGGPKSVLEAQQQLNTIRTEADAHHYVQGMLKRDEAFRQDYLTPAPHPNDRSAGWEDRKARAERARSIVQAVYEKAADNARTPDPAQLSASEREKTQAEIQTLMRKPEYMDKRHRDHDLAVRQVSWLHQKLTGGR